MDVTTSTVAAETSAHSLSSVRGTDLIQSDACHSFVTKLLESAAGSDGIPAHLSRAISLYEGCLSDLNTVVNLRVARDPHVISTSPRLVSDACDKVTEATQHLAQYIVRCADLHHVFLDGDSGPSDTRAPTFRVARVQDVQAAREAGRIPPELNDASIAEFFEAAAGKSGCSFDIRPLLKYVKDPSVIQRTHIGGEGYDSTSIVEIVKEPFDEQALDFPSMMKKFRACALQKKINDHLIGEGKINYWDTDLDRQDSTDGLLAVSVTVREIYTFLKSAHPNRAKVTFADRVSLVSA